ncbi:MAG: hypothetical protein VKP62_14875 [Candidatus Sericytochromatia bacterium]|nr:hypothetical protein [Candidatus Sericytochromatia bacterium]
MGPGIVTGTVTWNGQPAAGKRVFLLGGESRVVATDGNGRYTFSNISARRGQVLYRGEGDSSRIPPNEISEWRSLPFELGEGAGKDVPAIEVAYNGLLYPDEGMALLVSGEAVVPFHWSTHPRAQRYRVKLESEAGGFRWYSPWSTDPTAIFGQTVNTGRYRWTVEIDGGETGLGASRSRQVDF